MFLTVALFCALWGLLIDQLRLDWSTNPQYSYGWMVPPLAIYLFMQRWMTRPSTEVPFRPAWRLALPAIVLAACLLPTLLIREANPEWSLISWAMAVEVVGLTLLGICWMGGRAAGRHFFWPVAFILVAVSWPLRFENALTQALMHKLAAITTEILNLAGTSAMQEGNLIRLSVGVVGVDEACSGVRSLQSMFMVGFFLGELNRLSGGARALLMLVGLGLAVVFNLLRAMLLVVIALRQGLPALARWHDPAGYSILIVSFLVLCGVARLLQTRRVPPDSMRRPWQPLPSAWVLGFGAWLLIAKVATESWYWAHETRNPASNSWAVRWPEERPQFTEIPIHPQVSKLLSYSMGRQASWEEPDGSRWTAFFFRWDPGRTSTISARQHRPEVCLPASGRILREERPERSVEVGGMLLPFRVYLFESNGQPLHVYFCLWEMGNSDSASAGWLQDYGRKSRLQRVLQGRRNLGQESLEVIISGIDSPAAADAAFDRQMAEMLGPVLDGAGR